MLNTLIITSDEKKILLIHSLNDISEFSLETSNIFLLQLKDGKLEMKEVAILPEIDPKRVITVDLEKNDIQLSFNSSKHVLKLTGTTDIDPSFTGKKLNFTGTTDIDPSFLSTELHLTGTTDIDPSLSDEEEATRSLNLNTEDGLTGTTDIDPSLDVTEDGLTGTTDIDPSLDVTEDGLTGTTDIDPSLSARGIDNETRTTDIDPSISLNKSIISLNKIFFHSINLKESEAILTKEGKNLIVRIYEINQ